jgi:hypothetical protein
MIFLKDINLLFRGLWYLETFAPSHQFCAADVLTRTLLILAIVLRIYLLRLGTDAVDLCVEPNAPVVISKNVLYIGT